MKPTQEQVKALAQLDRNMDEGRQSFVRDESGCRWAFPAEVLEECGCVSGQTASHAVILALMNTNLANLSAKIAVRDAKRA